MFFFCFCKHFSHYQTKKKKPSYFVSKPTGAPFNQKVLLESMILFEVIFILSELLHYLPPLKPPVTLDKIIP